MQLPPHPEILRNVGAKRSGAAVLSRSSIEVQARGTAHRQQATNGKKTCCGCRVATCLETRLTIGRHRHTAAEIEIDSHMSKKRAANQ